MGERIAAIVVTHNRLTEIVGCIRALRRQTRMPDRIFVIDNGCVDGTAEWLDTQPDLEVVHQANLGTSGGVRSGHALALAQGFDWVWCMDDDAHPAPDALEALCVAMRARPEARVLNSVGMSRQHPTRFAVGALWVRLAPDNYFDGFRAETLADLEPYLDADGIVDSIGGHFYHGVLLHRSVMETVGSPLPWLFTYGEEIEYGYRIMRGGYHILAVTASRVNHPEIPFVSLRVLGKTKSFEVRPPLRRYFFIRNGLWVHRTYFRSSLLGYAARRLGGAFLAELLIIPNKSLRERLEACIAALRGVRDGLTLQPARDANGNPILA